MKPASAMASGRAASMVCISCASNSAAGRPGRAQHGGRGGAQVARGGEARRLGPVGDDAGDLGVQGARQAGTRDRAHVAAAAGDEDGEPKRCRTAHSLMMTPRVPARTSPMTWARSPRALRNSTAAAACCCRHAPPPCRCPQLKVRYISAESMRAMCCSQSNTGSRGQLRRSSTASRPCGQHARDVVGEAAAGDVREAMHRHARAGARAAASRRCASGRAAGQRGCGPSSRVAGVASAVAMQLADERVAVGVRPGGAQRR